MVIGCDDPRWNEYYKKMPAEKQDIYFTSQYYNMEQTNRGGKSKLFVYEDQSGNIGLYPFLMREIDCPAIEGVYFDIETAYGYGGPLVREEKADFVKEFENEFLRYCNETGIIAEFVRFHPLMKNERIFQNNIQTLHNRNTVWINLENDLEDIWMHDISTKNRNTIRKCIKEGLQVRKGQDYSRFAELYTQTMEKVGAQKFYYFGRPYFEYMEKSKDYLLFEVYWNNSIIASAIFMEYGNYFHYHLAGSDKNNLKLAPNNILLWEAIKYAKGHGFKRMHLGGGLTDSTEDSLFRFKQRFSSNTADFYIGKRIHNKEIYDKLIHRWEIEHNKKANILLQYRE